MMFVIGIWLLLMGSWPFIDPGHDELSDPVVMFDVLLHITGVALLCTAIYLQFFVKHQKENKSFSASYNITQVPVNKVCAKWSAWTYEVDHEIFWTWICSCGASALDVADWEHLRTYNDCARQSFQVHKKRIANGNTQ